MKPATTAPTTAPAGAPTLSRWAGVGCPSLGATAYTRAGGELVCKTAGSNHSQEWHAKG
jgi:hypothetical protein